MKIEAVVGAVRSAVGYLIYDKPGGPALIVDAPYKSSSLYLKAIEKAGVTVELIVDTHGHWDQIADNSILCKATGATLCAHTWDSARISDPRLGSENPNDNIPEIQGQRVDRFLRDEEELTVGNLQFTVMHTPGHTPGSLCLYSARARVIFVGDLMTRHGISRTDFTGSNQKQLHESLERIALLPNDTRIFPGHGSPTVLQDERWMLDLAKMSSA